MTKFTITAAFAFLFGFNQKGYFDLNLLKGKKIKEIEKALGKPYSIYPLTPAQIRLGVTGNVDFKRNGFLLSVEYNPTNDQIIDFFITSDHSLGDYKAYLKAVNLLNTSGFTIKPVKQNTDPSKYTGIIITPN
jgi:hypothetical protein